MDVIKEDHLLRGKLLQIETERADVRREFSRVFLEHHEHARLAKLRCPPNEELHGKHRLATPRGSADERGPPSWKSAAGYFIETLDAGRGFAQCGRLSKHVWAFLVGLAGIGHTTAATLREGRFGNRRLRAGVGLVDLCCSQCMRVHEVAALAEVRKIPMQPPTARPTFQVGGSQRNEMVRQRTPCREAKVERHARRSHWQ